VVAEEKIRNIIRRIGHDDQEPRPWLSIGLAKALYDQGRFQEMLPLVQEGEKASFQLDRVPALALHAKALARLDRPDHAVARALEAVDGIRASDHVVIRAQTLMDAAEALLVAGHPQKAEPVIREALRLGEQKRSPVLLERARRLARLAG
jgi:tetratricopeptide (TPR) repeat protein